MTWIPLIATALGAVIAFSGSALADSFRSRREQTQSQLDAQRQIAVNFILAMDNAHGLLRNVAKEPIERSQLPDAAQAAVGNAGVYASREQVLVAAPPGIALAAERAFHSIIEIRDAISSGSRLNAAPYREAYDSYAEAIWALRQVAREGFGVASLDLDQIQRIETDRLNKRSSRSSASS